jgi:hypothetical protein
MKNKGGRPTKFTKETVTKLEQAFAIGATVELACSYAEVSRNRFYEYLKDNPTFSDRIEDLRNKPILKAMDTVAKSLTNTEDAQWYLERKMKKEFSTRSEVGIEGEIKVAKLEEIQKILQKSLKK